MKVDTGGNRQALLSEAEVNAACRMRIREYMDRSGVCAQDFARRIGYGASTLRLFLADQYHNVGRTAAHLIKAANEFMDVHPVGQANSPLGELYDTENVRVIRSTLEQLLLTPVAYMIYAPPGSQKSFALEHQVAELTRTEIAGSAKAGRRAFYVYMRKGIKPRDVMRRVAIACGSRASNDIEPMIQNLRFDLQGFRTLIVIDEAQHLSIECFETLRELLDRPPYCSLLFAGSHDLKRKFDEFSATLEQWNSRIIEKVRLPGLLRSEAEGIVAREIGDLLAKMPREKASTKVANLIAAATVKDTFEHNRTYINVRSLTNALNGIKALAGKR